MARSISVNTKPRGRPKTTGTGALVGVRLLPPELERIDRWREEQPDKPSRPEAIRRLISEAFKG